MAVIPEFQKRGIGCQLIETGITGAKELNFRSIVVLGHPEYYPKFGFKKASEWNIRSPWSVPDEAWMALELEKGALKNHEGIVTFPPEYD